jgi:hypothetical protein
MVHFPALPSHPYEFRMGYSGISRSGFPHSEIPGSKPACGSPGLIAACHVLRRLLAPRHSPYALSSLTKFHIHTACVWSKNYRLRGIQLSKNSASPYRAPARKALLSLSNFFRRSSASACRVAAGVPPTFALRATVGTTLRPLAKVGLPPEARASGRRVVENTGLEPVTSWLQTRRSPS